MSLAARPSPRTRALEAWLRDNGVTWSDAIELVDARRDGGAGGVAVRAARALAEGEALCAVPKAAVLSARTASGGLPAVLRAEGFGGLLALVLAVAHELSLGAASRWHGYFAAAPALERLPSLAWTPAERGHLAGTSVAARVAADAAAVAADYAEIVVPLAAKYPALLGAPGGGGGAGRGGRPAKRARRGGAAAHAVEPRIALDHFRAAASLVASRAFGVDARHGDALVPLADAFNHKAAAVSLGAGFEVAEHAADSEEEEGEEEGGPGGDAESSSGGGDSDGEAGQDAALAAAGRVHACGGAPPAVLGLAAGPGGADLRLQIAIVDAGARLRIVAASPVAKGAEVFNCYGELGNADLVCKYGFALERNPFTSFELQPAAVLAAARAAAGLGGSAWAARLAFLRRETALLDGDGGGEPLELLPNAHASPALAALLRLACAPAAEARAWRRAADALGDDLAGLDPVQVWPVLRPDGAPLPAAEAAAWRPAPGNARLLGAPACAALAAAAAAAMAGARAARAAALGPGWEKQRAARGSAAAVAAVLFASEQALLADVVEAARRRAAALGAREGG